MDEFGSPTQQEYRATQEVLDPRRLGLNNSGMRTSDISDIICVLHPSSPAACRIVDETAARSPQHVLRNRSYMYDSDEDVEEQETFILKPGQEQQSLGSNDIALRFSSATISPHLGVCFGRNAKFCDIILGMGAVKRVSNMHFRIFMNPEGVLMLEDTSTNGTMVDNILLKHRSGNASTRMLVAGSIIQILSPVEEERIRFVIAIPNREGHEVEHGERFVEYMAKCAAAQKEYAAHGGKPATGWGNMAALALPQTAAIQKANPQRPLIPSTGSGGMRWHGGGKYNVIGQLGKGAFATVYKIATVMDGRTLAAKELEKKRFMKNGQLDQRLDNEMQIMKDLIHPNIVQYIDYHDVNDHLYIVMEYVPYGDLAGFLGSYGPLPEAPGKLMTFQILKALAYLHGEKITHRDIKPDNILVAAHDPFTVKLSDFGLSKVVKSNETFLKTFCGTLLYCAPEVFPYYHTYATAKGTKRRRTGPNSKTYHSYSQSVDIWSYAAVLWFSLCGKPPFEGVSDSSGRGMFEKIMETKLNPWPLRQHGITESAIDLLVQMLNTDPSVRPTEYDCLRHPWLAELVDTRELTVDPQLNIIKEEEEEEEGEDTGAGAQTEDVGAEEPLSQLSIHDRAPGGEDEEVGLGSDDLEDLDFLLHGQPSKRVKPDALFPRNQPRDHEALNSSGEVSFHSNAMARTLDSFTLPPQNSGKPRLFGEIGQSALQSSGILGAQTNIALSIRDTSTSVDSQPQNGADAVSKAEGRHGIAAAASLLGAESLVRELNMASPQSPSSPAATPNAPSTPKTPEAVHTPSVGNGHNSHPEEATPKAAPTFNRQIHLSKPASYYYDPYRPETHTLEYASRVSGRDFVAEAKAASQEAYGSALPPTMAGFFEPLDQDGEITQNGDDEENTKSSQFTSSSLASSPLPNTQTPDSQFLRPPPRLGKLTTTADSYANVVLRLESPSTSWGRLPTNTIVYPHPNDTRIPKQAFSIFFWAKGFNEADADEWMKLDGLYTGISTNSTNGIWVNDVHLPKKTRDGRFAFGKLRTGDVVTVWNDPATSTCLRFTCEFYHGEAAKARPEGERFEVLKSEP